MGQVAVTRTSTIKYLDWDSRNFGIRIGRVLCPRFSEETLHEVEDWVLQEQPDCLYFLADSDDGPTLRLASKAGFRMVDMRVTLGTELAKVRQGGDSIRLANHEDIPYLRQLAMESHHDSRFYVDGQFSLDRCDQLFRTWIERSVLDRGFAGAVFVPEIEGRAVGYITCGIKDDEGDIGLIALDRQYRRNGLGSQLLAQASEWFARQGMERVRVVTQGSNVAALRMYERYGFRIESTQLWFHWWRT